MKPSVLAIDAPRRAAPRGVAWRRLRRNLIGWAFVLPWIVVFLVFMAFPIGASLLLSFTSFGLADLRDPLGAEWIGLRNYRDLLRDDTFHQAALNTLYFVAAGVPLNLGLGLLIAMGVNRGVGSFASFFRVGYYLPVVTSIVAVAVIWRYMLNTDLGLLNQILRTVGLGEVSWLGNPSVAMPAIIALGVWRNVGGAMVIFLAGLQGIDRSLYEAAEVDGAGTMQKFRDVTLPLLRPTMLFVTITTSIGFLQVFEEPFVMTDGGPLNRTLTVSMYLYEQGFDLFHQGYASAVSYLLFLAIVCFAAIQFRLLRQQN
ncbi:MAG: carbohydrate ABC transporter permease [Thermomicrobiales bacterium]